MRKISYMYQVSGGTNYRHFCEECVYCQKSTVGKQTQYACTKHPEQPHWNPTWLSCQLFTEEKPKGKSKKSSSSSLKSSSSSLEDKMTKKVHQMTIMELLGAEI